MTIFYLIEKEFKQMMRNILMPILFVILPIVFMNVLPRLATQEIKNLTLTVVDHDHSSSSSRLIERLSSSTYFTLQSEKPSYNDAMADIENGKSDFIVVIEKDYEKNLVIGNQVHVQISANDVNGVKAGLGSGYLAQIISDLSSPITVQYIYNATLDYKVYMVPAVIALLVVLLVGFLPALNIVGEKEKGTIEQINVTPVGRLTFIFSKLIPYWIIGLFLISVSMLIAKALYNIVPQGSIAAIYLIVSLFVLLISSLGLIVSNYSSTLRQAALLMFFFLVTCILMSGMLTPIASMPEWAQSITLLNPFRYIIAALRILYIRPVGIKAIELELEALGAFAIIFAFWAIRSYKKSS